jgi:putative transposase
VVSPQARREQVAFACERGLSERRACGLLGIARSTLGYELRLPAKDRSVIEAMRQLSSQYPRYGYRRIRIFLKRQGHQLGWHRAYRLWRQAGLQLPRRRPRRRIATGRPRPAAHGWVWMYASVSCPACQRHDRFHQGDRKRRAAVDDRTSASLSLRAASSTKSATSCHPALSCASLLAT